MRYGKVTVWLATLLFAAMAVILWIQEPRTEGMPLNLILTTAGREESVDCWKNEAGAYYLFLPSYADPVSAQFRVHAEGVTIDGKPVASGMSCDTFALNTPLSLSFDSPAGTVTTVLTVTRSENLPTLYLDTASGSMDYIHGKKGNQETGRLRLYTQDGNLAYEGKLDAVNGRGNDWLIAKKSYSLRLAAAGDLLGMGQAEKWILTSNAFDGSHLRNKLVYDFADALGLAYSPQSQWVDLYLNGEYAGLYLLCERNELHEQRVSPEGTDPYLVSMDAGWRLEQNGRPYVTTESGHAFRIHGSSLRDETLQQLLQSVENAISAENGMDPMTGKHWSELIDPDSWAKKYLIEEVFGNSDGGAISQYFYGSDDKTKMYAGPVWDYDISMGSARASGGGGPESIFAARPRVLSYVDLSWYYELFRQEAFREQVVQLYRDTCLPLLDDYLNARLDAYSGQIAAAAAMNQIRWDTPDAAGETEKIRRFMEERLDFLNQLWLENKTYCSVLIIPDAGRNTVCHMVQPGQTIPALPDYEESGNLGWYDAATEAPFDGTQPIYEDTVVYLKQLPEETEGLSVIQLAPAAAALCVLACMILADKNRRRQGY